MCQGEIKSYERQLAVHEVLVSLVTAERDLAARELSTRETAAKVWREHVQIRRQKDAIQARAEAELARLRASGYPPSVQEQYDLNIRRGLELEKLTRKDSSLAQSLKRSQDRFKNLEEEFTLARERVEAAVLTETTGLALREQRRALPNLNSFQRDSAGRRLEMSEIREAQFDVDRGLAQLADIDGKMETVLREAGPMNARQRDRFKKDLKVLLADRRVLLEKLQSGYQRYFKKLQELEFTEQQMVGKAEEYAEFLDKNLLWIRSSRSIFLEKIKGLTAAMAWAVNPVHWWGLLRDLTASFTRSPFSWGIGLLVWILILTGRRWIKSNLSRVGEGVGFVQMDTLALSWRALILTSFLSLRWPFLMWLAGRQLLNLTFISDLWFVDRQLLTLTFVSDFSRAVGAGLWSTAPLLATIGFIYHLCRPRGLAHVHFGWTEEVRATWRRNLIWLGAVVTPLWFVVYLIEASNNTGFRDTAGRLAFMAVMIVYASFTGWILRARGGIMAGRLTSYPHGWTARLRYIWYPISIGGPLILAILAAMGFYYTALVLVNRFHATIGLIIVLILVHALLTRGLLITKSRLAYEEAKRKFAALQAQYYGEDGSRQDGAVPEVPEEEIELARIDEQTQKLLGTFIFFAAFFGLWAVWSSVLPALAVTEKIHLWSYAVEIDGVTRHMPITLANLTVAVVAAVITYVSATNLPGALEVVLLNRLSMEPGAKYAFTTICRYVITAVGLVITFSAIGVSWSSLQWLIAALSVGLGFGLQEIVANFVSGLIVLFERPFRIGDVVTVGDTIGTVTRIRIRATTITDWDRRELIVPNKEFITGKLINWSLTDNITRVRIKVGVAYGSDIALVEKLMLKVARENQSILDDPAPYVIFMNFGDSSLEFELFVYLNSVMGLLAIRNEVNQAIDREFRAAGVVVSFPQRDIHLDVTGPLGVRVFSDRAGDSGSEPDAPLDPAGRDISPNRPR